MKLMKNILSFIAGVATFNIIILVEKWLLFDLIGQFTFIRNILSWPIDYYEYALGAIVFTSTGASVYVSAIICSGIGKRYIKIGSGIFCICSAIFQLIVLITTFVNSKNINIIDIIALLVIYGGSIFYFSASSVSSFIGDTSMIEA